VLVATDDLIDDATPDNEYHAARRQHGWSASSRARMRARAVSSFDEGAEQYEQLLARMTTVRCSRAKGSLRARDRAARQPLPISRLWSRIYSARHPSVIRVPSACFRLSLACPRFSPRPLQQRSLSSHRFTFLIVRSLPGFSCGEFFSHQGTRKWHKVLSSGSTTPKLRLHHAGRWLQGPVRTLFRDPGRRLQSRLLKVSVCNTSPKKAQRVFRHRRSRSSRSGLQ